MAKKSLIEKNNRRRRMAKKFAARRAALKAIAHDKKLPTEERFAATLKLAELPRNSSADPHPQPLRIVGPPARLLPQAPPVAHRVARARVQGADSRPRKVELVRRIAWQ